MLFYLLTTSAAVSVDSFLAGLAIGAEKKHPIILSFIAVFAVGLACFIATAVAQTLFGLQENAARLGGIILIAVGAVGLVNNLRAKNPTQRQKNAVFARKRAFSSFLYALATGFGVGADGACACISLSLMGYGYLGATAVVAFHFIFILLGVILAKSKFVSKLNIKKISPLALILLGAVRLI